MVDKAAGSIMLFFTSANPPTGSCGQVGLVAHFVKEFEHVRVVPINQSTKVRSLASYQHRVNMARLAFEDLNSKVIVTEEARDTESASLIPLIQQIKEANVSSSLSLVMGSDAFEAFLEEVKEADAAHSEGAVAEGDMAPVSPVSVLASLLSDIKVVPRAGHSEPQEMAECSGVPVKLVPIHSLTRVSSNVLSESIDAQYLIDNSHHDVLRYCERKRLFSFSNGLRDSKVARPLPRNPTLESTAALQKQTASQRPQHFLSEATPLLSKALCEMLKRKVTDQPCEWLGQYLKLHKDSQFDEATKVQQPAVEPAEEPVVASSAAVP